MGKLTNDEVIFCCYILEIIDQLIAIIDVTDNYSDTNSLVEKAARCT